ncbi:MAG: thiamine pyrophosphate-binding protein [Rhodospirillales bacterium]|nr:thiamine pyrophosphate-binding protein [Rhodospirillales bacterium]
MRGADLVATALSNAGVKVIFTLSGNQIMPIFDACIDVGIRLIHTRHEGAAVYMAEAYSQLTGEVGIALVTAAPGFASGLGPLYMARMSETPIVLLSGDSPLSKDDKGAFQELDQITISTTLTKLSLRPQHAENLALDIAMAMRVAASGRPGPVHVALPFDLLNADVSDASLPSPQDFAPEVTRPGGDALRSILDTVTAAERPVILTGPLQNRTRARGLLEKLADALDAPVIPMESPRGLKDPCLGDFASVLSKADVIVSLGKNIDYATGFGLPPAMSTNCKFFVVDPETDVLERARRAFGTRMTLGHRADADATAQALAEMGKNRTKRTAWRAEMAAAIAVRPVEPVEAGDGPMRPAVLCAAVQRLLDAVADPILIVDGGEFGQWAQAFVSAKTRIINGPSGAIGGTLCYAVAAKIARPDATVVVLMGDGTVGFHFAEFETAHRYGTDFIAVIGHDARWNAEYQIQLREYGADRLNECELNPTRYDLAAAGFGCHGEHVTNPADLDAALKRANESGLPVCFVAEIEGLPAPSASGH